MYWPIGRKAWGGWVAGIWGLTWKLGLSVAKFWPKLFEDGLTGNPDWGWPGLTAPWGGPWGAGAEFTGKGWPENDRNRFLI